MRRVFPGTQARDEIHRTARLYLRGVYERGAQRGFVQHQLKLRSKKKQGGTQMNVYEKKRQYVKMVSKVFSVLKDVGGIVYAHM